MLWAACSRYRALMFAWGPNRLTGGNALADELSVVRINVTDGNDRAMQLHDDESYTLTVPLGGNAATLFAATTWGALRGLETLSQLVEWRAESSDYELRMAPWEIQDAPRFPYRGVLIVSHGSFFACPRHLFRHFRAMPHRATGYCASFSTCPDTAPAD